MPFADPTSYSKGRINRAGQAYRDGKATEEDLHVINNWRASHGYVLNTFQATLRKRTRGQEIITAERHKRLKTILNKLERQPRMELARMDDVAGCRVIFDSVDHLYNFRRSFHRASFGHKRKNDADKYDYIQAPKPDGYRGIHDIYEYNTSSTRGKRYNGLLLELQYRTAFQHAWATTVEVVGMITENQPKFDRGDNRYLEFFRLSSEIISRGFEYRRSCLHKMRDDELVEAFRKADAEIHLLTTLRGLKRAQDRVGARKNVILSFTEAGRLDLFEYVNATDAMKKYFELEKANPHSDTVLVKADTADAIRTIYKNYFTDVGDFIDYVDIGCAELETQR